MKNRILRCGALWMLGLVFAAVSPGATLLIDNFSTDQTGNGGVLTGANSVGGARFMSSSTTPRPTVSSGFLSVSPESFGSVGIHWDGDTDGIISNGGLSVDLSGYSAIVLAVRSNFAGTARFSLYTNSGNRSIASFQVPNTGLAGAFQEIEVPLSSLQVAEGSGADLGNVTTFRLVAPVTNIQTLQIDNIELRSAATGVPEPGTAGMLLLAGVAGLTASARRQRRRANK